ncbi:uncharacterized protein [Diabrotica undecimpunctata]|uniref:uncharacterized protein n=1 Tax=Diabrotica undecimpunctata TaxID=50387 RepID=UPI003B6348A3
MKLNLIFFVAICIYGVQSHALGESEVINNESAQALLEAVRKLLEVSKNPEHVRKQVIEHVKTIKDTLTISTSERSLIPDLKHLVGIFYHGLGSVVKLLLPPNKDLFDVSAEAAQKFVRYFVHDNQPLLELLDKLILAGSNIARVSINSALEILLGPLNNDP